MFGYLIIRPNHEIELVESEDSEFSLKEFHEKIDCDYIENVRICNPEIVNPLEGLIVNPLEGLFMVIDEEGKLTGKEVNFLASVLYGSPNDVIMGNVVIGVLKEYPHPDVYKLPLERAKKLKEDLEALKQENKDLLNKVNEYLEADGR